jgi:hypothetical protein
MPFKIRSVNRFSPSEISLWGFLLFEKVLQAVPVLLHVSVLSQRNSDRHEHKVEEQHRPEDGDIKYVEECGCQTHRGPECYLFPNELTKG